MQVDTLLSVADYLRLDAESETKHEYHAGQVYAMAGASLAHNTITANVSYGVRSRLRSGTWRVLQSHLRVHVENEEQDYTYPDVVMICGAPRLSGDRPDTLLNPVLLVEVASPSTSATDREWKLRAYMQIESLQEYWIVEQDAPIVTRHRRHEGLWVIEFVRGRDAALESGLLAASLPLADIYDQLFPPPAPGETPR